MICIKNSIDKSIGDYYYNNFIDEYKTIEEKTFIKICVDDGILKELAYILSPKIMQEVNKLNFQIMDIKGFTVNYYKDGSNYNTGKQEYGDKSYTHQILICLGAKKTYLIDYKKIELDNTDIIITNKKICVGKDASKESTINIVIYISLDS